MSSDDASAGALKALFLGGLSGDGLYEAGDLEGAARQFDAALQASWGDPSNLEPAGWWSERLARCELLLGRLNAAMTHAQESIKIRQMLAAEQDLFEARWRLSGALLVLGDAHAEQGAYDQADRLHEEALALSRSNNPVVDLYGSDRARGHLRKLASLRSASLLLRLGDGAFRAGQDDEALALWHEALALLGGFETEPAVRLGEMLAWVRIADLRPRDARIFGGAPLFDACIMEAHHALAWQLPLDARIELAHFLDRLASLGERRGTAAPWLREAAVRLVAPLLRGALCPSLAAILRR